MSCSRDVPGQLLYRSLSLLTIDEPYFRGLFRKHSFLGMCDRQAGMRFSLSPSGLGQNPQQQTTNPAGFSWFSRRCALTIRG